MRLPRRATLATAAATTAIRTRRSRTVPPAVRSSELSVGQRISVNFKSAGESWYGGVVGVVNASG
eukprot:3204608-Pleurochrysis_carterae.AAC.1